MVIRRTKPQFSNESTPDRPQLALSCSHHVATGTGFLHFLGACTACTLLVLVAVLARQWHQVSSSAALRNMALPTPSPAVGARCWPMWGGHFLFCWYFCWYFCRNCTAVIGQCGSLYRNQTAFRHHHAIQRQPSPDPTNACAKGVPVPPVDNWPAHTTRAWTAAARCASSPRSSLPTA